MNHCLCFVLFVLTAFKFPRKKMMTNVCYHVMMFMIILLFCYDCYFEEPVTIELSKWLRVRGIV